MRNYRGSITIATLNYFNELGQIIVKVKEENCKLSYTDINPEYVRNMRDIGITNTDFSGGFNCGTELDITRKLFGENEGNIRYRWYFESLYKIVCEMLKTEYITYRDQMKNKYSK